MAAPLLRQPSSMKRWMDDDELENCPICRNPFEGNIRGVSLSGRAHCRFCGGVFCNSCCSEELYMPEDEVVRPPATGLKAMMFDPADKQKACRNCAHVLLPLQEELRASRISRGSNLLLQLPNSKKPPEPYFTVTVVSGKGLVSPSKGRAGVGDPVCLLTVGNSSNITRHAAGGLTPVWDQSFDFPVSGELGNTLKLSCYEEEQGGKELIGEGSLSVSETGAMGVWVAVTDYNRVVTGEVLLRIVYRGPRAPKPPLTRSLSRQASVPVLPPAPSLTWLQEKMWVVYVAFLAFALVYKLLVMGRFTGEVIVMRPGTTIGNDKWVRSGTHFLHMQRDGNLVLKEGTSPRESTKLVWQSGRPFGTQAECPKCVASLGKDGSLVVKDARKVLKSFNVEEDKWLGSAISFKGPK